MDNIPYKEFCVSTSRYKIHHKVRMPTRMSDYDYDSEGSQKRFISFYLHTLEFYDILTNVKLLELDFSSEICASILTCLYDALYRRSCSEDNSSIQIPTGGMNNTYMELSFKLITPSILAMSLTNSYSSLTEATILLFNYTMDIKSFIDLLEIENIFDMYVVPSSDRW